MRILAALLLLLPAAHADEVTEAADRVLESHRASGDLKGLAAAEKPDRWTVTEELCARGEFDAAGAFAKAAPDERDALVAYAVRRRTAPEPEGRRAEAKAIEQLLAARDGAAALKRLDALGGPGEGVMGVLLRVLRATALGITDRNDVAMLELDAARALAERLGWLSRVPKIESQRALLVFVGGMRLVAAGETAKGLAMQREAVEIARKSGRPDDTRRIVVLLGSSLLTLGRPDEAQTLFEEALRLGDPDDPLVRVSLGTALFNRGRFADALHEYDRALPRCPPGSVALFEALANSSRALAIAGNLDEAALRAERAAEVARILGNRPYEADTLRSLGGLFAKLGDVPRARACIDRLREVSGGASGAERVVTLEQLALLCGEIGDPEAAADAWQDAVEAARKLGDFRILARFLASLGTDRAKAGRSADALAPLEEAVRLLREAGDFTTLGRALMQLGGAYEGVGDLEKAVATLEQAEAITRSCGDLDTLARVLTLTSTVAVRERDWTTVVRCQREAERCLRQVMRGLSAEGEAAGKESLRGVYTMGRMGAFFLNSAPDLLYFAEAARGGALLAAMGGRETVDLAAVPEELLRAEREAAAREAEAVRALRAAVDGGQRARAEASKAAVDAARAEVLALSQRIERERGRAKGVVLPDPPEPPSIANGLAEGEVLVHYDFMIKVGYVAILTDREGTRYVELGKGEVVPEVLARLGVARDAEPHPEDLAFLRRFLIEKLELPGGTRRLLVSPMKPLTFVPFALLAPDLEIAFVPSASCLLWLRRGGVPMGEGVLAVGGCEYRRAPEGSERSGLPMSLAALPGTRAEAEAVGTDVLLGARATEAGLVDALKTRKRWRAVHLAGHGIVDEKRPAFSAVALTPGDKDDGFLTVREILAMQVPADLVVLSACETARGREYEGEGVFGLAGAFMVAGAPRVLVSLWKVDDEATRALMVKFHGLWKAGRPCAAALREAQAFVAAQPRWEKPFFWAAWQLWGLPE